MSEFETVREPPREPVGMKIVGTGVIASCLLLSVLFAWGIYLNLTRPVVDCPAPAAVVESKVESMVEPVAPIE